MKEIYIVLTKSKSILSHVIDLLLPSEYTHASISFDFNLEEMYSVGRVYAFTALPARMKKESLDKSFYRYYKQTKMGIYSILVSNASFIKMKNYVEKLYQHKSKLRFSILGILCCSLNIRLKRKNRMFCSEFVCNVLKQANENLINICPELCYPKDLLTVNGLKAQYIGTISDFIKIRNNAIKMDPVNRTQEKNA